MTPDELARYVASDGGDAPEGWDVVVPRAPGVPADEYADAGATWLVDSTYPTGDWVTEFEDRIRQGPRT